MRTARTLLVAAAVALLTVAVSAAEVRAGMPPPVTEPYVIPFGSNCYQEVEIFSSFQHGDFDFCRLKLRYTPGRAECLRILISTCNLVVPRRRSMGSPGGLDGYAERIICPPGPPPPTCPSGYFG